MSHQKLRAIYKQLTDKIEDAKEAALFEVKELKADLNELQRHLAGRKKVTDIQPDDVLRSAYEITHHMREISKRRDILAEMEDVAAQAEALEYLESRGAKLLHRPAGWHFQTAKERFLLHEDDPVQAADELRKLLAAGKRLKRPGKPKKAKPAPARKKEPTEAEAQAAAKQAEPAAKSAPTKAKAKQPEAEQSEATKPKTKEAKAAESKPKKAKVETDGKPASKNTAGKKSTGKVKTKSKTKSKTKTKDEAQAEKSAVKKPAAKKKPAQAAEKTTATKESVTKEPTKKKSAKKTQGKQAQGKDNKESPKAAQDADEIMKLSPSKKKPKKKPKSKSEKKPEKKAKK